jgi:hypothetical protein
VGLLAGAEFGLLAAQLSLGLGHGNALTGAHPQQVDFELGERGQDVEERPFQISPGRRAVETAEPGCFLVA